MKIKIILSLVFISMFYFSCSAPQFDEDFLKDDADNSMDNLIIHSSVDSTITLKIDTISQHISALEGMINKFNDFEFKQKIDSILKDLMDLKRSSSTPIIAEKSGKDFKIESLEKRDLEFSKRLDKLEKKLRDITSKTGKETTPKTPSKVINTFDDFNANYDLGINQFKARKYDEAVGTFQNLLTARLQKPDLMDNIHYWLGECYYAKGNYRQSIEHFRKVLSYPKAEKVDDTLMMMGLSYEKINNIEDARESYQRLIDTYPKSKYIKQARSKMKNLI